MLGISIGYACVCIGEPGTTISACRLKNATQENLRELTSRNLAALDRIIDYNIRSGISLFRISSDIIPFGSHPASRFDWQHAFQEELKQIGQKIKDAGIRVSMHPGQYTVMNSPTPDVVQNALLDLEYHTDFLDALGCGPESKIILHVGGVYGNKQRAAEAFTTRALELPGRILRRLAIENDEKNFTVEEVLAICRTLGVPAVFDNLHNKLNPSQTNRSEYEWIALCGKTWAKEDGRQKIHYSQGRGKGGAHAQSIAVDPFLEFYNGLPDKGIDIMLEVKDKNCSAVKCVNLVGEKASRPALEREWARYKYLILSKSAAAYNSIRAMLVQNEIRILDFYRTIETALAMPEDAGAQVNAAQHVWGYFKKLVTSADKNSFERLLEAYATGGVKILSVKKFLFKNAEKYGIPYLRDSFYFYLE